MWYDLATSIGRVGLDAKPWLMSFDGILATTEEHAFKGLKPHTDNYAEEPGQLQLLLHVYPPPPKYMRLGFAVSFYANNPVLWRDQAILMVTRASGSPDMDYRFSPAMGLGSQASMNERLKVCGGKFLSLPAARNMSCGQLKAFVETHCPAHLAKLLPATPAEGHSIVNLAKVATFLKTHGGVKPLPDAQFGKQFQRSHLLQAVAAGKTRADCRDYFSMNIIEDGFRLATRSWKYNAPEKLKLWAESGGRIGRRAKISQPSGRVAKRQKKQGIMKSTTAMRSSRLVKGKAMKCMKAMR